MELRVLKDIVTMDSAEVRVERRYDRSRQVYLPWRGRLLAAGYCWQLYKAVQEQSRPGG